MTNAVTGPLPCGRPMSTRRPPPLARGYDDVAFLNGKVYLGYTNSVNPTDSALQVLTNGNNPSGTLNTASIITA